MIKVEFLKSELKAIKVLMATNAGKQDVLTDKYLYGHHDKKFNHRFRQMTIINHLSKEFNVLPTSIDKKMKLAKEAAND